MMEGSWRTEGDARPAEARFYRLKITWAGGPFEGASAECRRHWEKNISKHGRAI